VLQSRIIFMRLRVKILMQLWLRLRNALPQQRHLIYSMFFYSNFVHSVRITEESRWTMYKYDMITRYEYRYGTAPDNLQKLMSKIPIQEWVDSKRGVTVSIRTSYCMQKKQGTNKTV
jgi:hypothetical protein